MRTSSNFVRYDKLLRDIINDCNDEDSQTADLVRNAGALLGTHLVNVLQVLDTEFCVLTGPLGRNRIYVEAFRKPAYRGWLPGESRL